MNVATILKAKGRAVTTVLAETSLLDVSSKLAEKKIGAVVVVGEAGRVIGIISERDVIRAVGQRGPAALAQPVADVMTRNVITCSEGNTIEDMMAMMTQGRFRHLPVVDGNGALTGIISIGDVVKHHIAEVEMELGAMRGYLVAG